MSRHTKKPPASSAEVRAFLANRATTRPTNSEPNVALAGTTATIRLYDPIDSWGGWWGMSAAEVADAVDKLPADVTEIRLLINSPGGDVFDGVAITNILGAHPARIVAVVQGIAASAASFIATSADELVMNPGSMLMIHDASGGVWGWADDMRQMSTLLDQISDNIAGMYATKAGGTTAEWRERMLAETWYTAEEAVTAGLANSVGAASADDAPFGADVDEDPSPFFEDRFSMTAAQAREFLNLPKLEVHQDNDDAPRVESRPRPNAARLALLNL